MADKTSIEWTRSDDGTPGSSAAARPMRPERARSLRDQRQAARVPFLFKQAGAVLARVWGCADRKGGDAAEWPEPFPSDYPSVA
jgi:protein gp37